MKPRPAPSAPIVELCATRFVEERQASASLLPPGLLDLRGVAIYLCVGISTVERLLREGLPHLDLGQHHPRRRPKRLLRFSPEEVLSWVHANCRNGGGGA